MQNKSVRYCAIPPTWQLPASPKRIERCERRYDFRVPLVILAFASRGPLFHEVAFTRNLSPRGFCLHLLTRPQIRESLAIGIVPREAPSALHHHALCEIAWMREEELGWVIGAQVLSKVNLLELIFGSRACQV